MDCPKAACASRQSSSVYSEVGQIVKRIKVDEVQSIGNDDCKEWAHYYKPE
jgi:hypothetical protein